VLVREVDGTVSLVMVDHAGREEVVPVVLVPVQPQAKRAA
jgi:hypothetical protein